VSQPYEPPRPVNRDSFTFLLIRSDQYSPEREAEFEGGRRLKKDRDRVKREGETIMLQKLTFSSGALKTTVPFSGKSGTQISELIH
jgi:hypothetical protein